MVVSKLKASLPRFPICREHDEDDIKFLVIVEQEARVIVGSYTRMEHEACMCLNSRGWPMGLSLCPFLQRSCRRERRMLPREFGRNI
jgi:hypothetical protein